MNIRGAPAMYKCRITVIKTDFNEDLVKEYGAEGVTRCPLLKEGQVFLADYEMPEGFCDIAWRSIYPNVFALSHGEKGSRFKFTDWVRREGLAIDCCHDGLRPVFFKIEVTDIPSDYTRVSAPMEIKNDYSGREKFAASKVNCEELNIEDKN